MIDPTNTIASVQTPPGKGGIAVISLAGPDAQRILHGLFKPMRTQTPAPTGLQLGHIYIDGAPIDEAIVCCDGNSIEINIHGGPQAARGVLEALRQAGAVVRPPSPLDPAFCPRHPRWDNPAVGREMLAALADAHSQTVVAALSQQWHAGLSQLARETLQAIESLRIPVDDSASKSVPHPSEARACPGKPPHGQPPSSTRLRAAAAALPLMRRILVGAEVVLAGPPNAGKSTLANALTGRQVSIVHATAGTTRDWVRELALIHSLPLWLTDTAGIWETPAGPQSAIDAQAVRRALECVQRADLVLLLSEGRPHAEYTPVILPPVSNSKLLTVATKCDCPADEEAAGSTVANPGPARQRGLGPAPAQEHFDVRISAHSGLRMDDLKSAILRKLGLDRFNPADPMAFTARQADLLLAAAAAIEERTPSAAQSALAELLAGA